ncbi:CBL-interacting serine/threonine-protein kinase 9, partial [Gonapodya sp. JEL0774]
EVINGKFATWNISHKVLGSGSFAVVKEAINLETGNKAVVKICTLGSPSGSSSHHNLYPFRELATLSHVGVIHHPNIVRLLDGCIVNDSVYIFEEKVEGVELFDYLKSHGGRLPIEQVRTITAQLLSALRHIHKLGVLHRDIKLDNIIINAQTLHVTLIDFNLASFYRDDAPLSEPVGCINYSSPQILEIAVKGTTYLPAQGWSDLWALGVAIYGMMVGFFPFKSEQARSLLKEQTRLTSKPLNWFVEDIDPVGRAFVERILTPLSVGTISAES